MKKSKSSLSSCKIYKEERVVDLFVPHKVYVSNSDYLKLGFRGTQIIGTPNPFSPWLANLQP